MKSYIQQLTPHDMYIHPEKLFTCKSFKYFWFQSATLVQHNEVSIEIVTKEERAFSSFALAHYFASRTNWVQKQTFKQIFTPDGIVFFIQSNLY